jgi:hypothetical protein
MLPSFKRIVRGDRHRIPPYQLPRRKVRNGTRDILSRQQAEGWGAKIIGRLGHDLQNEFPGTEGFSPRNLKYMRRLAEAWPEPEIVPQLVALLPWGHLRVLLDRIKTVQHGSGIYEEPLNLAGAGISWSIK